MSPTSYQLLYSAIYSLPDGAGDRTRTGTVLLPGDFKSPVSTIPPHRRILARIRIPHSCGIVNTLAQYFCPSTKLGPLLPSTSVSKSLAEFAARRRQKMGIIFHRDMCVGENTPQAAILLSEKSKGFFGSVKRGPRKPGTPKICFYGLCLSRSALLKHHCGAHAAADAQGSQTLLGLGPLLHLVQQGHDDTST